MNTDSTRPEQGDGTANAEADVDLSITTLQEALCDISYMCSSGTGSYMSSCVNEWISGSYTSGCTGCSCACSGCTGCTCCSCDLCDI